MCRCGSFGQEGNIHHSTNVDGTHRSVESQMRGGATAGRRPNGPLSVPTYAVFVGVKSDTVSSSWVLLISSKFLRSMAYIGTDNGPFGPSASASHRGYVSRERERDGISGQPRGCVGIPSRVKLLIK